MPDKVTVPHIGAMRRRGEPIVCVTAYDSTLGALADQSGADLVLVGDTVANVALGYSSTIPVTLADMVHHTRATRAGVSRALLVADLPFGSYEPSIERAIESSVELVKAGAEAVKLEGDYPEVVEALVRAGIPVVGHLGLTPQSVNVFGGFRVQGKGEHGAEVKASAQKVDGAGAFALVLELVPAVLAEEITSSVRCATIGIGAGVGCSGQIQVMHDILGLSRTEFKHSKKYIEGFDLLSGALRAYGDDVRAKRFPGGENSF